MPSSSCPCSIFLCRCLLCSEPFGGGEFGATLRGQRDKRGEDSSFQKSVSEILITCYAEKRTCGHLKMIGHSSKLPCIQRGFLRNLILLLINETDWLAVCLMTKSDRA